MTTTLPSGPARGTDHTAPAQRSVVRRVVVPALLVLIGLAVMLYPVVASQWNNYVQDGVAKRYEQIMEEQKANSPELIQRTLVDAHAYNQEHTDGPILDPWLARVSKDNQDYQDYLQQLSGQDAMSQLSIPSIDSKLPVYHGTDAATLQKGLGHLYGSALPVGGEGMHAVITGHTGITNATLWDNLIDVKKGDAIYINTFGEKMKYQVYDIETVLPDETDSLKAQDGRDLITLITCTPYGINTHRLLVHAERVPMDAEDEKIMESTGGFTMQWWMWLVLVVAAVIIAALVWWIRRMAKEERNEVN
ncbi:class C sortase [Corynebacterium sp. LK2510]|uniref:class C sortase n=1 Tax=Corynebacterium sp. LK2510 TaxID=3110472 RepID=UPI0034CE3D1E